MQRKKARNKLRAYSAKEQVKKLNQLSMIVSCDKMRDEKAKKIVGKVKFDY